MLHPTMPLESLYSWAKEHAVDYALSYPAKMLLVPTSKIHTNWLWIHQQSNTTIQEIITRPTAHTLEEASPSTAPLEFQQAAIHYLEETVKNSQQALEDEVHLLAKQPPSNPILKKILEQALQQRARLRQSISPRSKKDRRTQKLWLDVKHQRLQYKEETIAWCGEGNWAELFIYLDGRQRMVTCNCLNGKQGRCRLGLSAIDQTIEMLTDSMHLPMHTRIIKELGTPKWERDLQLLDPILESAELCRPGESLGWRIKETKQGIEIESVWCIQTKSGWKHRKANIDDIIQHGGYFEHRHDDLIANLVQGFNPKLLSNIMLLLQDHPRFFVGTKSNNIGNIESIEPSLHLQQMPVGVEWKIMIKDVEIFPKDFETRHYTLMSWFEFSEDTFRYAKLNNKIKILIEKLSHTNKIIPNDAITALFQRLSKIEQILPLHLDPQLLGESIQPDNRPTIRVTSTGQQNLRLEFVVKPTQQKSYQIGTGIETIYLFNQENQSFGYCSRNLSEEIHQADRLRSTLHLPYKDNYQWTVTTASEIFETLLILQRLPPAHHQRIEWLSNQPIIQHTSLEHLSIDVLNTEQTLELQGGITIEDTHLNLWDILPAIRQNNPYLLVKGHIWYSIAKDFRDRLRTLADIIQPQEEHLYVRDSHIITLNNILQTEDTESPLVLKEKLRNIQPIILSDQSFHYTLRPYQIEGVKWMLNLKQWTSGCILADEMGLGKTIQVINFLHEIQDNSQKKTLVIAPKSTHGHWMKELTTCLEDWTIIQYSGPERVELLQSPFSKQCLIMTYDVMVRDIEHLLQESYATIIFDEAQYLKNPQASRFKSANLLQADFSLALTGTPIENSLLDLWSIFQIVLPKHLGSWGQFKKRFIVPIEAGNRYRLEDLKKIIKPFLLRRQKEDVALDLPEKLEVNEFISLSTFEQDTYDQLKIQAKNIIRENPQQAKFLVLSLLTKLRQVCCHRGLVIDSASDHSSKLDRAMEIINGLHQDNRKVLVFSQFVQLLKHMKTRLENANIEFCYLDGSTHSDKRQSEIDRFQETDVTVFLISLKAGGSGINLTKATEVIHLDPWWNPAVEDQASDRAHRIGQLQTVTVIRLVAENTIESQILRLQQEKRHIAQDILSDSISKLSLHEIEELLD